MRFTRWIVTVLLVTALFAGGTVVQARTPVQPFPPVRQPRSVLSPKSGLPKSPITAPKGNSTKKRNWFPFGNKNKK
jgi:hypothetical protein